MMDDQNDQQKEDLKQRAAEMRSMWEATEEYKNASSNVPRV